MLTIRHCPSYFAVGTDLDSPVFHRQGEGVKRGIKEEKKKKKKEKHRVE